MQLYTAFYKMVYNSCFRILRDKEDAEDAMQESFIKAFSHLGKYEKKIPFEAWITRIAINTSIDKLREDKLEFVAYDQFLLNDFEDSQDEDEWEQTQEKVIRVKSAIEKLPNTSRIIISLYLIEGYDHEEIAQILKIQPGTVRIQYMRAKQQLVKLINQV
jgi:RNA polymerase sigma-70 factor (ECF subfamily)